jgi:DNA polymerase
MIVGEASGEHEAQHGRPFIEWAPSGSILEKAIKLSGSTRDDFWLTNVVRCRPPNNFLAGAEYERSAIDHCRNYLDKAIEELRPRAILALGSIPTRELTGFCGGKKSISYVRGYPIHGPSGIPCIPSYHPAFISRGNTRLIGLLVKDIMSARSAASGRLVPVVDPIIEMDAEEGVYALEELYKEALADPFLWIAYDIETETSVEGEEDGIIEFEFDAGRDSSSDEQLDAGHDPEVEGGGPGGSGFLESSGDQGRSYANDRLDARNATILSIQFAVSDTRGVYGDWRDGRVVEVAKRILELPNPKIGWNNSLFDDPILRRHGVTINGDIHDGLLMRRALQPDLPAGLQQVAVDYGWGFPWKHYSGSNSVLYGVSDVCSLVRIAMRLPVELDKFGMWTGYNRFIRDVRAKVLDPWERRGIPMSKLRLDEFRQWLTEETERLTEDLIQRIPEELHGKHPKEGYKNAPDVVRDWINTELAYFFEPQTKSYKNGNTKLVKSKTKVSDVYKQLVTGELPYLLELLLSTFPDLHVGYFGETPRLYEKVPFNPRSSKQMISYIKHMGYEVPKTFKDGKETTGDKLMKRLEGQTKDPVIKLSREIRVVEKMRDSYTGNVDDSGVARGGWIPDSDGRLRTRALTKSTWQFSSVSPNVFTMPKRRGDLAKQFRRCMAAEPGHVLVEFDYKAFHDLTTAALAGDERKWRTAKIDPHSYVAGWLVKYPGIDRALDMSDEDLKQLLLEIKKKHEKVRDEQAKPLNHGTNFGQSYRRLYFENEEYFESETQAKQLLLLLKRVYPKTFAWQEQLLESLDTGKGRTPYLQSVWGARRWFWDVWIWKKNYQGEWYKAKGQDAEKALAFLPANHAHGMFRLKMLEMAELGWLEKYELVNFPHDALVFHPPAVFADECIANVKEWMEAPVMELAHPQLCPGGFSCGVDIKIGPDLGTMEGI